MKLAFSKFLLQQTMKMENWTMLLSYLVSLMPMLKVLRMSTYAKTSDCLEVSETEEERKKFVQSIKASSWFILNLIDLCLRTQMIK